ncbi:zinc finger BED domain-containing protein RICESLEEPER 2-like protein, partial [Tanacetum coccineum]
MEDDMLKAQSKVVNILCNLELIYPPGFFNIMIHMVIHLPLEALEGGPIRPRWMYPSERFIKKLKNYVRKKAKPEDKDPGVSASSELFALACRPTPTLISVNSCVVNSVRFIVHSRDECRTTQNSGICSPGEDKEMYYGQLEEILENDVDEDVLPHDLADSGDEYLVNVDDNDGVVMSADVAMGHGGDDAGDDRPPPHQLADGCR